MSLLEIRNLTWQPADADRPIWADVSFEIAPGELVVLEGFSGSGKSTLLRAIVGLEEATSGTRWWQGEQISAENIRHFRHRAVYIHQTPVPIAPRVAENLDFPRQISRELQGEEHNAMNEDEQRKMLDRFNLGDLDWSRRVDELSVGERQRIAFVRCLTVRPQMLLLDEPTASLDPKNARQLENCVFEYLQSSPDRSAIWVSHDEAQRDRMADRTIDISRWTG